MPLSTWLLSGASYYIALFVLISAFLYTRTRGRALPCPLPPGPPADPVIGHLRRFPATDRWPEVFGSWSKTYGDVMYLNVLGNKMIVLDSLEACNDLLDKRRPIYSNRPRCTMLNLIGVDKIMIFLQYGKDLALHRKLFQSYFGVKECRDLMPLQQQSAQALVRDLLATPEDYINTFYSATARLILRVTYGHELKGHDDPILRCVETITGYASDTTLAMSPLDIFPWLIYLPRWLPGNYWSRWAHENHTLAKEMYDIPFELVQEQMRNGAAKSSFVSSHLTHINMEDTDLQAKLEAIKLTASMSYAAGMETTGSSMIVFLLAMVLFPNVQEKAQREIDKVVGYGRLPTFEDRLDLLCIDRIIYELGRWAPITPLGVPHASSEDNIYRGMFIPKGTTVMANILSIGANEKIYKDPATFNPDRFLPNGPDGVGEPTLPIFGFGARLCPGRFMAEHTMWINIATILASCSLQKAKDENENEIVPKIEWKSGTLRHLKPFPFVVTPRSNMATTLIEQTRIQ